LVGWRNKSKVTKPHQKVTGKVMLVLGAKRQQICGTSLPHQHELESSRMKCWCQRQPVDYSIVDIARLLRKCGAQRTDKTVAIRSSDACRSKEQQLLNQDDEYVQIDKRPTTYARLSGKKRNSIHSTDNSEGPRISLTREIALWQLPPRYLYLRDMSIEKNVDHLLLSSLVECQTEGFDSRSTLPLNLISAVDLSLNQLGSLVLLRVLSLDCCVLLSGGCCQMARDMSGSKHCAVSKASQRPKTVRRGHAHHIQSWDGALKAAREYGRVLDGLNLLA
jgi:hypothetical protein